MNSIITVDNISKRYTLTHQSERFLLAKTLLGLQKKHEFWALKNLSFTVERGTTLGIIGRNGAGKSTLLKILSGVTSPTQGKVKINGRILSLLELGAGFHQDLTGRENIYLNATLIGYSKQEIKEKFDAIIDFAELGEFIDEPLRTYSSGMQMRLGFSIAVFANPEILIVDEVLSVGDQNFQKKSFEKFREFKIKDVTIIIVSHALNNIEMLCNKVLWLEHGAVREQASGQDIKMLIERYKLAY